MVSELSRKMSYSGALGFRRPALEFDVLAGLVPAIHDFAPNRSLTYHPPPMRGGWVYIMTNRPNGTLYVGVTADIARRAYAHRRGLCEGFTRRYALTLEAIAWMAGTSPAMTVAGFRGVLERGLELGDQAADRTGCL